jgi:type II secretion system protein G
MNRLPCRGVVIVAVWAIIALQSANLPEGMAAGMPTQVTDDTSGTVAGTNLRDDDRATRIMIGTIEQALNMCRLDIGAWPTTAQGIEMLVQKPDDAELARKWNGPYLPTLPIDRWQRPFSYRGIENSQEGEAVPVIWSWGADGRNNTADDIGNWQSNDDQQESGNEQSSQPTTWKELGLEMIPGDYPVDGISLVNGLNQARGTWVFSGARLESGESKEVVARISVGGSFRNALKLEKFPSWQFGLEWIERQEQQRAGFLIIGMPAPNGFELMLVRPPMNPLAANSKPRPQLFQGAWNAETQTIIWTLNDKLPPGIPQPPAAEANAGPPETFEMVFPDEGGIVLQNYRDLSDEDALRLTGRTQHRIGEPFVEKELEITRLPNGYQMFFASNSEVFLMNQDEDIIAGARVAGMGVQGNLIFGEVTKYGDNDTAAASLGYFWVDSNTGEIQRGLDLESWRARLKEQGVEEPELSPPESFGPRF